MDKGGMKSGPDRGHGGRANAYQNGEDIPRTGPMHQDIEHESVMLHEAVDFLMPRPGGIYVDATVGGGGHAEEILARSSPDGILIGLDRDADAVQRSRQRLSVFGSRAVVRQADFRYIETVAAELGYNAVDGVLFDLGVSWFQLKSGERGFSFMLDGPLDMRMDRRLRLTAADLVNGLPLEGLKKIIKEYGEEPRAAFMARAIVNARRLGPITTTRRLAEIIEQAVPKGPRRIHPATRTFQALRIAVNDELASLKHGLEGAIPLLRPKGRIVVISFHSLEDRIVKQVFREAMNPCICPGSMPVCMCGRRPSLKVLTKRPVLPSQKEVMRNPASRSARLRAAEKIDT